MADSVVKLRIDSKEYDANIKRAGDALNRYFDTVKKGGGTLKYLDEGVLEAVRAMGSMETAATSTRGKVREFTQALADLTSQYRSLTDEEKSSPLGTAMAESISKLTERAGEAKDAMGDAAAAIKNAASDTRAFDQIGQGVQVMTSAFQVGQGAAKLFGITLGDNVEVIANLQAAMSVTTGLMTVQNAIQKESALMQGVLAVQAKAAAAAVELQGSATKGATVAQAAFNAVAKANPYVLLASAVLAVGAALFAFSKDAKKATEAAEENTDAMKEAEKMANIWKNTMGSTFSSLMTRYDELKNQWNQLKTEHQKREWINENKNALNQLGVAVYDVKTAEDFFNSNTDAVVQSFVRRAQAAARVAQLTELYRKQIELLDKKSSASAAIATDAEKQGRRAVAGQEISDPTFRNSRYGSVNAQGKWTFSAQGAALYSGTNTANSQTVRSIDAEIASNSAAIEKVKNAIASEIGSTYTPGGGGGGRSGGGGGRSGGGRGGDGKTDKLTQEELTIQQKITALEEEALTASEERKAQIRETINLLDDQLEKEKEIKEWLHQDVDVDAVLEQQYPEQTPAEASRSPFDALKESISADIAADNIQVDENSLRNLMQVAMQDGIDSLDLNFQTIMQEMAEGMDIPDTAWQEIEAKINEIRVAAGEEPIVLDVKTGNVEDTAKTVKASWKDAAASIGQAAGALAGLENPAAKITGLIGAAVAQIALGFAQASATEGKGGVWYWIAATAAGLATMISTIASIHSATGYAEGGIVQGNTLSNDQIPAMLNAGEVVLSHAQQRNLANELEGGGLNNLQLSTEISGRNLRIVLNNDGRVRGMGRLVTTNKM